MVYIGQIAARIEHALILLIPLGYCARQVLQILAEGESPIAQHGIGQVVDTDDQLLAGAFGKCIVTHIRDSTIERDLAREAGTSVERTVRYLRDLFQNMSDGSKAGAFGKGTVANGLHRAIDRLQTLTSVKGKREDHGIRKIGDMQTEIRIGTLVEGSHTDHGDSALQGDFTGQARAFQEAVVRNVGEILQQIADGCEARTSVKGTRSNTLCRAGHPSQAGTLLKSLEWDVDIAKIIDADAQTWLGAPPEHARRNARDGTLKDDFALQTGTTLKSTLGKHGHILQQVSDGREAGTIFERIKVEARCRAGHRPQPHTIHECTHADGCIRKVGEAKLQFRIVASLESIIANGGDSTLQCPFALQLGTAFKCGSLNEGDILST